MSSEAAIQALRKDRLIDITTKGRKSGKSRRIEIGFTLFKGKLYLTGRPGKRSWYANLIANPNFTLHLKQSIKMDLPGIATPVSDPRERRALFEEYGRRWAQRNPSFNVEQWLAQSPLVEVAIPGVPDALGSG